MNLLPFTPDTMRGFKQEIVVDTPALLRAAVGKQMVEKLPELVSKSEELSYLDAYEALKSFRDATQASKDLFSDVEKEMAAEVEVEWCLDILGRLSRAGKLDD